GIKRAGSTLVGKFGSALDASSTFRLKIGDYGFRFLNLVHQSFSLVLTQCSRVSNHSAVTPPAFPFCAVAKIRRIRSCASSTSSTALRRAGEGSCVSRIALMTPPNARRIPSSALVVSSSSSSSIMIIHHWFVRFLRHTAHENVAPSRLLRRATPPDISGEAADNPTRGLRFPSAAGLHHDFEIERTVAVHTRHAPLRFIAAD